MLTISTTFNPENFDRDSVELAISSWLKIEILEKIIIYGVPDGMLNLDDSRLIYHHVYEYPAVNEILGFMKKNSSSKYNAYVNSDIILKNVDVVINSIEKQFGSSNVLVSGFRQNIKLVKGTSLKEYDENTIRGTVDHGGMDVFIYSRDLMDSYPHLWIAGGYFDQAFVMIAKRMKAVIIDASKCLGIYHIDHEEYGEHVDYHKRYMGGKWSYNRRTAPWWRVMAYPLETSDFIINADMKISKNSYVRKYLYWIFEYIQGLVYHALLLGYPHTRNIMHLVGKKIRKFNAWRNGN